MRETELKVKVKVKEQRIAYLVLDEMPEMLSALYRTLYFAISSPFSQPQMPFAQAFCRAGGGPSGL